MGLIKNFSGKRVFLDTAPLIYYIEENRQYAKKLQKIFTLNAEGDFKFITSVITLLEVLVLPLRLEQTELAEQYSNILCNSSSLWIYDVNIAIVKEAAQLRAVHSIKTPDAIQIATAINTEADYFLTNDTRLKTIKEINIITLDDL